MLIFFSLILYTFFFGGGGGDMRCPREERERKKKKRQESGNEKIASCVHRAARLLDLEASSPYTPFLVRRERGGGDIFHGWEFSLTLFFGAVCASFYWDRENGPMASSD